jgi:YHS domain-containing protein
MSSQRFQRNLRLLAGCLIFGVAIAVGCHGNLKFCDETEDALGKTSGHNPAEAGMDSFNGQISCPVCGQSLAEGKRPVPVTAKGITFYACCPDCADKVKMNAGPYLAKVLEERNHPQPKLMLGPYDGQQHCPVTGDELDPEGNARWVQIKNETVYVCCMGCANRVRHDPEKYLKKVRQERAAAKFQAEMQAKAQLQPQSAPPQPVPQQQPQQAPQQPVAQPAAQ